MAEAPPQRRIWGKRWIGKPSPGSHQYPIEVLLDDSGTTETVWVTAARSVDPSVWEVTEIGGDERTFRRTHPELAYRPYAGEG
jgi:hypothetical protein